MSVFDRRQQKVIERHLFNTNSTKVNAEYRNNFHHAFLSFFFFAVLEFELRAYTLSHSTNLFFKIGFINFLPRLASNHDPPDICLLSS
jgi:hypothetical protein